MPKVRRRKTAPPKVAYTPFQKWIQPIMQDRELSSMDLAEKADRNYNTVWKVVEGDPKKYPTAYRPGYELCLALGRAIGDERAALQAAEHPLPESLGGSRLDDLSERAKNIASEIGSIVREATGTYTTGPAAEIVRVPFIGHVSAGHEGIGETDYTDEFIPVFVGLLPSKATSLFAFRVRGECLAGEHITNDDVLICEPAEEAKTGEIVIVEEHGERFAKRYRQDRRGKRTLETVPATGEPEIVPVGQEARIVGICRLLQRIPGR